MNRKLVAIDLDRTTLNRSSVITSKTKETLEKAANTDHHVSITTGRPFRISHQFYQQLELTTPMVNSNGALIRIPNQHWDGERETLISREITFEILSQKEQLNSDFIATESRDTFSIDSFDFPDEKIFASPHPGERNLLSPKNLTTNPTSLLVRADKRFAGAVSAESTRQFGSYVDVRTWGGPTTVLEIVSKGVQKAKGMQKIADCLSVDQRGTIAFGDGHNDLELLDCAGQGIAMANGTDQLKGTASDVTPLSNQEDGLAIHLKKLLKL